MKYLKLFYKISLYGFAILGLFVFLLFIAHQIGLTNSSDQLVSTKSFKNSGKIAGTNASLSPWASSREWNVLKTAFIRENATITKVANDLELDPRMLISPIISEQIRAFGSERASFESYFEPVKKMINLTQFSYGIAGIKPETAKKIEEYLKDVNSPYYLGKKYENMLDYAPNVDIDSERIARLTNDKDHTYSYLYAGLMEKMLINEWDKNGIDISQNAGVVSTLYNLGFNKSKPKENPAIGGAIITVNGTKYPFGQISDEFYKSSELRDIFE